MNEMQNKKDFEEVQEINYLDFQLQAKKSISYFKVSSLSNSDNTIKKRLKKQIKNYLSSKKISRVCFQSQNSQNKDLILNEEAKKSVENNSNKTKVEEYEQKSTSDQLEKSKKCQQKETEKEHNFDNTHQRVLKNHQNIRGDIQNSDNFKRIEQNISQEENNIQESKLSKSKQKQNHQAVDHQNLDISCQSSEQSFTNPSNLNKCLDEIFFFDIKEIDGKQKVMQNLENKIDLSILNQDDFIQGNSCFTIKKGVKGQIDKIFFLQKIRYSNYSVINIGNDQIVVISYYSETNQQVKNFQEYTKEDLQNNEEEVSFGIQLNNNDFKQEVQRKKIVRYKQNNFDSNRIQVGDYLIKNFEVQNQRISEILELKKYFIEKLKESKENEDIFDGYKQTEDSKDNKVMIKIKYLNLQKEKENKLLLEECEEFYSEQQISDLKKQFMLDLQKEVEIIQSFEKKNLSEDRNIKVSPFISIIVINFQDFEQIQQLIMELKDKVRIWNLDYFQSLNKNIYFDSIEKSSMIEQFKKNEQIILNNLKKEQYFLCQYMTQGGEGIIFSGYQQHDIDNYEDFIFKIVFYNNEQVINEEVEIMKKFEENINVIKFYQIIKITKKIFVYVLEKCKFSLGNELKWMKKNKIKLDRKKLFSIIFDLVDGLIQMRIYNILHMDIKPDNILVSINGDYVYSDFGISSFKGNDNKFKIKGYSEKWAPLEQIEFSASIDYSADIFSLGKTFDVVIQQYLNQNEKRDKDCQFIKKMQQIIKNQMVNQEPNQRISCLELHNLFFEIFQQQQPCQEFNQNYLLKIQQITDLFDSDNNKDIPYFKRIQLYYFQKALCINKNLTTHKDLISKLEQKIEFLIRISELHLMLSEYEKALNFALESQQIQQNHFQDNLKLKSQILSLLSQCYLKQDEIQNALKFAEESLEITKNLFQGDSIQISSNFFLISQCYIELHQYQQSQEFAFKSLQIRQQIYQGNHYNISSSLLQIAQCYNLQSQYQQAFTYAKKSIDMNELIHLGNDYLKGCSLFVLAQCYLLQDDYQNALNFALKSLNMFQFIFSENNSSISLASYLIAECYKNLDKNEQALEFALQSLKIKKLILKNKNKSIDQSMCQVAKIYYNLYEYQRALEYSLQSLEMRQQIYSSNNSKVSSSLQLASLCYKKLDQYQKSLEYALKSYQINEIIYEGNHFQKSKSLDQIAICQIKLGDYQNALKFAQQSLEMKQQIFQGNTSQVSYTLSLVADCYNDLNQYQIALKYSLQSLEMSTQIFKKNNFFLVNSLLTVAKSYKNLDDHKKALRYALEALIMCKLIYPQDNLLLSSSLILVAQCYCQQNNFFCGIKFAIQSLQIVYLYKDKQYHPQKYQSTFVVAEIYYLLECYQISLEFGLKTLEISQSIFQDNHPIISKHFLLISKCYYKLNDFQNSLQYALKSLEIHQSYEQGDTFETNTIVYFISQIYIDLAKYQNALEFSIKSLYITQKHHKCIHPQISCSLFQVAKSYIYLNNIQNAIQYALQSLEMALKFHKRESFQIKQNLLLIAVCYYHLEDEQMLIQYYQEGYSLQENSKDDFKFNILKDYIKKIQSQSLQDKQN